MSAAPSLPSRASGSGSDDGPTSRRAHVVGVLRGVLERPLASYQLLLGAGSLLLGIGMIMVLSASSVYSLVHYGNAFAIFFRQVIFCVIGLGLAFTASRVSLDLVRRLVYPLLIGTMLLIGATFVAGVDIQGNRNWLPLFGPFLLQPSEFAKLAIVLWAADLYARKEKILDQPKHVYLPMLPVTALVAMLVVMQGDLGTALVLFAVIVGMLFVVGLPGRHMGAVLVTVAAVLVFFVATAPHRVARLLNFMDPMSAPDAEGYQSVHSMMALATGQFWGVGLGGSRQKWGTLPEAHTDFILAVIGEELGLVGTLVVLVLFALLAYAGIRVASRTQDAFARYAAAGITIWITWQAVVNIGMVLGLLPVIGIPLPLVSYGGSSLIATLVGIGLLVNFAKTEPGARKALAARSARRGPWRDSLPTLQRR